MTTTAAAEHRMQVANTVLSQLGGNRFIQMTGAKDLLAIDGGLQFKLPNNLCKDRINFVRIILDPSDTYTVEFGRITRVDHMPTYKALHSHDGIYCDNLTELFTQVTGLYTRLF